MTLVEEKSCAPAETTAAAAISVRNVLFASDFSATSEAALPYAAAICRRFGSTLHVAHILSDANLMMMTGGVDYVTVGSIYEDAHTDAKEKIEQIASRFPDIPHRTHVRHGQVWKNLAPILAENQIDLIVVGTHGRTGLGKLLLGSVAEDILRHAPCPVLTIGPRVEGRAKLLPLPTRGRELSPVELELRQIVYATNLTQDSLSGAPVAVRLAAQFHSRLTLIHVIENYNHLEAKPGPIEDGVQRLRDMIPADAGLQYKPEAILEFGEPAKHILQAAYEREADLIVLGARPAEELVGTTHLPWSTAHQVLANASCPVLTVRG